MVVIDESCPQHDQRKCDQEQQVGRVADMHHLDPVPHPYAQGKAELGQEGDGVFAKVGDGPPRLRPGVYR